MPNSLNAYNLFWNSKGSTTGDDQPKILEKFLEADFGFFGDICAQYDRLPH
jgi:hypothetical protein